MRRAVATLEDARQMKERVQRARGWEADWRIHVQQMLELVDDLALIPFHVEQGQTRVGVDELGELYAEFPRDAVQRRYRDDLLRLDDSRKAAAFYRLSGRVYGEIVRQLRKEIRS